MNRPRRHVPTAHEPFKINARRDSGPSEELSGAKRSSFYEMALRHSRQPVAPVKFPNFDPSRTSWRRFARRCAHQSGNHRTCRFSPSFRPVCTYFGRTNSQNVPRRGNITDDSPVPVVSGITLSVSRTAAGNYCYISRRGTQFVSDYSFIIEFRNPIRREFIYIYNIRRTRRTFPYLYPVHGNHFLAYFTS